MAEAKSAIDPVMSHAETFATTKRTAMMSVTWVDAFLIADAAVTALGPCGIVLIRNALFDFARASHQRPTSCSKNGAERRSPGLSRADAANRSPKGFVGATPPAAPKSKLFDRRCGRL
jgi:hypothetical protein